MDDVMTSTAHSERKLAAGCNKKLKWHGYRRLENKPTTGVMRMELERMAFLRSQLQNRGHIFANGLQFRNCGEAIVALHWCRR